MAVAAFVETRNRAFADKTNACPGRHFVLLDQKDHLLGVLTLGNGLNEQTLGRQRAGPEIDHAHRLGTPVQEQAQERIVTAKVELFDDRQTFFLKLGHLRVTY